ncbi:MAG: ATP-grasp domain-containing protein [Bacteroidetes bacterium]|nr:ATP-grasp domain-containing protein [Bacteroidota bacterium]
MEKTDLAKDYKINEGPLKVELIKVLRGANYFSAGPVILTRLSLGEYDEVFSNEIDGFYDRLESTLPTLYEHHCSEGKPGGFFFRVRQGTLMGHVIEHVAIELQSLAGMQAGYGKTRSTLTQGVYNIIFRFIDDKAGIYAAKAAVNLINALLMKQEFDVNPIVNELINIREERLLGPSTQTIVDEALKRNIPIIRLDQHNLIQLGTGKYQKRIRATITSDTNFIGVENATNKYLTTLTLRDAGLPIPETLKTINYEEAKEFFVNLNDKAVIKPAQGSRGENVFLDINDESSFLQAFSHCIKEEKPVLIQRHIPGNTYRLLIINGKMIAATKLTPPVIIGNGNKTVLELVNNINSMQGREPGDKGKLSYVITDEQTEKNLSLKGLKLDSIIEQGLEIRLESTCNPAFGAFTEDVTEKVHPENRFLAERAANVSGLNVAGVTIVAESIEIPITKTGGVILEVNAGPDFRMHVNPAAGNPINPAIPMLDMLFPKESRSHVPLISITGSAGKSVCAYLINFALEKEGFQTGLACSDGLFAAGRKVISGNMTYPEDVPALLGDTSIDCAILETSVEGILKDGLGYQFADVGIFLNLFDNHLHQDDIWLLEDLAYAKSVVTEEVYESGFSVLNADNPFILEAMNRLYSKPALFSKNPANKELTNHMTKGGMGAFVKEEKIFIHNRSSRAMIADLKEVPLTFNNTTDLFLDSILAACCALTALGVAPEKIGHYLKSFSPLPHNLPGRMNFLKHQELEVLYDNPKNKKAFDEIKKLCSIKGKGVAAFIFVSEFKTEEEFKLYAANIAEFADLIYVVENQNKTISKTYNSINSEENHIIGLTDILTTQNSESLKVFNSSMLVNEIKTHIVAENIVSIINKESVWELARQNYQTHFPVVLNSIHE